MRSIYRGGLSRFFAPPPVERCEPDAATQAWLDRCKRRQAARDAKRERLKAARQPHDTTAMDDALRAIREMKAPTL
ncbi:hypothetical protein [Methylorubrum zatmanii]